MWRRSWGRLREARLERKRASWAEGAERHQQRIQDQKKKKKMKKRNKKWMMMMKMRLMRKKRVRSRAIERYIKTRKITMRILRMWMRKRKMKRTMLAHCLGLMRLAAG